MTVRELHSESAEVWHKVARREEIVPTRNGKPFAIIASTQPSNVESDLRALRSARFGRLLDKVHAHSLTLRLDKITLMDVNAEIALARTETKAARDQGGR